VCPGVSDVSGSSASHPIIRTAECDARAIDAQVLRAVAEKDPEVDVRVTSPCLVGLTTDMLFALERVEVDPNAHGPQENRIKT